MACPECGDTRITDGHCEACGALAVSKDAQAASAWAPDPRKPQDFKSTVVATRSVPEPAPPPQGSSLNSTWLTLGLLVAFCLGVVYYLATR
jgi:hypothetical protein